MPYADKPLSFLSNMDSSLQSYGLKIPGLEARLESLWLSELELPQLNKDLFIACDVVSSPISVLGIVQALEPAGRAGRVECLPASVLSTLFS